VGCFRVTLLFQDLATPDLTPLDPASAKRREWMGMGVAGMIITSDDWDHSRKFPAFSTSKFNNT
jgi:hypothetical protein